MQTKISENFPIFSEYYFCVFVCLFVCKRLLLIIRISVVLKIGELERMRVFVLPCPIIKTRHIVSIFTEYWIMNPELLKTNPKLSAVIYCRK